MKGTFCFSKASLHPASNILKHLEVGKARWMCWLFLFDHHLCSVRWLWFAHARPSSGSKFSAQCFSIIGQWCENFGQGYMMFGNILKFWPVVFDVWKYLCFLTVCTSRQHRGTRHDLRFHIGTGTRCLSTDVEHVTIRFSLHISTIAKKSDKKKAVSFRQCICLKFTCSNFHPSLIVDTIWVNSSSWHCSTLEHKIFTDKFPPFFKIYSHSIKEVGEDL